MLCMVLYHADVEMKRTFIEAYTVPIEVPVLC